LRRQKIRHEKQKQWGNPNHCLHAFSKSFLLG